MIVYIIQSEVNDTYYTGMTANVTKRLHEHNKGKNSYTKKFKPWKLIYVEVCENRESARIREKFLKTTHGKNSVLKK